MKSIKRIVSVLLVATMAVSLCACGSVKEVAPKEFKSIVKDVMDCDSDELYEDEDPYSSYLESIISYSGSDWDKYTISISEYEDEEAAQYYFDYYVNDMKFIKDHDGIEGKIKFGKNYYVIDAEVEPYYDADTSDVYGGCYIASNYIIEVTTNTGKDKDRDVVDELLDELGYPKPSRA